MMRFGALALGVGVVFLAGVAAAEQATITYEISGTPGRAEVMKQWSVDFMKLHPDIKVVPVVQQDVEHNLVALTAGSGPDLIISDWNAMVSYSGNGFALPLDDYLKADDFDLGQFYQAVLDGYRADGHLYELPIKVDTHVMVYNRDAFSAAAVPFPTEWSWDQLRSNAKKLTQDKNGDGKIDQYGYGTYAWYFDGYIGPIWQNGGKLYQREGGKVKSHWSDPNVEEAVQFLYDLMYKDNVMMSPNEGKGDGIFTTGKVASYFVGEWHLAQIQQAAGILDWDIAQIPYNKEHAVELGGIGYLVNKSTKYPKAAVQFLEYVAGSDQAQKSVVDTALGLSALKRMPALQFPGKHTDAMLQSMNYVRRVDMFPEWSKINDSVEEPNIALIWANKAAVKPTLEKITQASNAILGW
ncbi:MAG TPA: extracellular solute-binding protein [Limnochordia bacterium]|nr:extracellular solute-binding protein [Limnochordia bacterium]